MLGSVIHGPRDVRADDLPEPTVLTSNDAVVRVVAACVCGSDLWPYRGVTPTSEPHGIGHELVGVVEALGDDVTSAKVGDLVVVPFSFGCGECQSCLAGFPSACDRVTFYGGQDRDGLPVEGAQSARVRIPFAQSTLVPVPLDVDEAEAEGLIPSLLTLADVMSTGHHAAVSARVGQGSTVVVVGDGAVGLCAVVAAKRLGASRIVIMSRHADRTALARELGATDVVAERGEAGIAAVREILGGLADCALECVGTDVSMQQALGVVRGGGSVGFVGVPNGGAELPIGQIFRKNLTVGGGMAPARSYIEELLPDVLSGAIDPGRVFDLTLPLSEVAEAYAAMDERRATKVLLRP
ncbi:zinc-binding dehydrogenase [Antribacter gilvus]|uniref:zinc-binding dehydrogenase n=1 Tax=Antribacter gilvus TaxID=2304675 RepID=UPI000F795BB1|nr:alcohol dehydrogenase catalytic domain-containing protein [Antribacter gilvus]